MPVSGRRTTACGHLCLFLLPFHRGIPVTDAVALSFSETEEKGIGGKKKERTAYAVQGCDIIRVGKPEGRIFGRKCLPGSIPGYGDAIWRGKSCMPGVICYRQRAGKQCCAGKTFV